MLPSVSFLQVSHEFSRTNGEPVLALDQVDLELNKNEFVAVVGPSGCGKSTLLRLLSGILSPSKGQVMIFGSLVEEPRDEVGIVFQKPTLLPWLSVLDNVLFPIRHKYGTVSRKDQSQALDMLELVGLADCAERRPDELSGGMQQRVGIARALLLDPEILLMDEPFSALDALNREEMGFELQRIWEEKPKTVLFITHSITEAVLLADRVLVMSPRPGRLLDNITIDIPRPRTAQSIEDAKFHEYAHQIRRYIYQTA